MERVCPAGKIQSGLPPFGPPPFSLHSGNTTYSFLEMCGELGSGLVVTPIVSVLANVAIAKAFCESDNPYTQIPKTLRLLPRRGLGEVTWGHATIMPAVEIKVLHYSEKQMNDAIDDVLREIALATDANQPSVGLPRITLLHKVSGKTPRKRQPIDVAIFHMKKNVQQWKIQHLHDPMWQKIHSTPSMEEILKTGITKLVFYNVGAAAGKSLDATQEMLTLGLCNVFGSFVQSTPTTGAFTRSAVSNASGVRTPMAGLYSGTCTTLRLVSPLSDAAVDLSELQAVHGEALNTFTFSLSSHMSRGCGCVVVRLLASHLGEPGSTPGGRRSRIFACGNRARRCRCSAGILRDLSRFPRPCILTVLRTDLASPSSALKISMLRATQTLHSLTRESYQTNDSRDQVRTVCMCVVATLILLALSYLTPYFYYIPRAALSAVLISAVMFMIEYDVMIQLWKKSTRDLLALLLTLATCLAFGVEVGLLIGAIFNAFQLLYYWARPVVDVKLCKKSTFSDQKIYRQDTHQHPERLTGHRSISLRNCQQRRPLITNELSRVQYQINTGEGRQLVNACRCGREEDDTSHFQYGVCSQSTETLVDCCFALIECISVLVHEGSLALLYSYGGRARPPGESPKWQPGKRLCRSVVQCYHTSTTARELMGPRWYSDQTTRIPPRRAGFDSRQGRSRIFACGNRAGRCRWSGILSGISRIPRPCIPALLHTHLTSPSFIGSQGLDV
ncbi:hypothetical protein PR048_002618, partial [Dryococelus australis]